MRCTFLRTDLETFVFNQYRLTTLQCVLLLPSGVTWYQADPPVSVGLNCNADRVTSHILANVLLLTCFFARHLAPVRMLRR